MSTGGLATRRPIRLLPDPSRVITQLFVPGHYLPGGREEGPAGVVKHILGLSDAEVTETLAALMQRFGDRHRDLPATFEHHADRIRSRLRPPIELSVERSLLLGATFTLEYAVQAAALCNPSAVALPDQTGVPAGALRFVMSVRQIGEGHRSSVGFRTGLVDADGDVTIDERAPFTTAGTIEASALDADAFRGLAQRLATRTYTTHFSTATELTERVLYPATTAEANGIEDARFVRFVDDDGSVTYYATCTAFDGVSIAQQLVATDDFVTFAASPLQGAAAANKGLALFPRRVHGQLVALSRHDGAGNAIAFSDDIRRWPTATPLSCPTETWEAVQVGNCGAPIETDDGWLVLTHGVGAMRTYSIGALLLDLDDPTKIIGRLREPLLSPLPDEQDGYVPNVVYSCGALRHGSVLLIPFGVGDASISFATVPIAELVSALHR